MSNGFFASIVTVKSGDVIGKGINMQRYLCW